jgi:aryl-alcohol dehydrogenase-like predicted oxidoreductase
MTIPKRTVGRTGVEVTHLGLGGEGILRTFGHEREAYALINRALDLGVTYCESARAYSGSEAYYGQALRERRREVFLTSKSHARDRKGARAHLHETLSAMQTDHLDLWQVHDMRTSRDIETVFGPGGAIEAFIEAREQGKVRFIGVTGHENPFIIRECLERFDFDTVLLPINPAESQSPSFLEHVIPLAQEKGMGIIGMKVYLHGFASRIPGYTGMEPFLRYALTQPLSTVVIGCDDLLQVEENVRYATAFEPMTAEELRDLEDFVAPYARQLMYYRP